ncbi:hypothetical protein MKX01_022832 [Papaver californicum]|nr:hypothetical protein MKX01_022832 [Papaver californicum]
MLKLKRIRTFRRKLLEKMSCRTTKARRVVIVGGGYIGMEVAAAAVAWKLDTTIIFPEDNLLPRLFTPSLARRYEELYQENGVKFLKGSLIKNTEAGSDGHVAAVKLENGSTIEADTIIICVGAKPAVQGFEAVGLDTKVGGIQVDGLFQTNVPGIFAIGDVAAFPLKIYDKIARVEHVDHARKSAQHCVKALLDMIIFHTFTQECLSTKEVQEKFGGNSMVKMLVKQLKLDISILRLLPSGLILVIFFIFVSYLLISKSTFSGNNARVLLVCHR